jgi:hypothetical protein
MPPGLVAAPLAIIALTLLVPFAFRYLWPGGVARPPIFLAVTLTLALIVAAISVFWFLQALVGVGISGAAPASTFTTNATFEAALRTRLISSAIAAVVVEYWLCRATQFFLGK